MAETQPDPRLEIAHVLFMDIVGFSKSLINEQSEMLRQLNQVVRDTAQVKAAEAAGRLIRIPTGGGMALGFFTTPDAPLLEHDEHRPVRDEPRCGWCLRRSD